MSGTLVLDCDGLSKFVRRTPELEREPAAIEMTEAITVLTDGFVPDEVYGHAAKHFDEAELSHLIAAITTLSSPL